MTPKTPIGVEHQLDFWRKRLDAPHFVYAIQGGKQSPIKIGRGTDPFDRLKTVQTGNPERLQILYVCPGDHRLEWQLHQRLKPQRLAGEWFQVSEETIEVVRLIAHLAKAMREGYYEGPCDGQIPDFKRYHEGPWIIRDGRKKTSEVTVHFEDPSLTKEQLAEKLLEANRELAALRAIQRGPDEFGRIHIDAA